MTTNKPVHPRPNRHFDPKDQRPRAAQELSVHPIELPKGHNAEQLFRAMLIQTLPAGNEEMAWRTCLEREGFTYLPGVGARMDIPHQDGRASRTAFAAHMDDVSGEVTKIELGTFIQADDQPNCHKDDTVLQNLHQQIIGADCRAGVAVLLSMARQRIPGRYLIFEAEEIGLVGSRASVGHQWHADLDRMVSFDRSGTEEIITHMHGGIQTASDAFAQALSEALSKHQIHLRPSPYGSSTDAWAYKQLVPECVNISVGYSSAHTSFESQNVVYLRRLAQACAKVNWDELPSERDPGSLQRRTQSFGQTVNGTNGEELLWNWERVKPAGHHPEASPEQVSELIEVLQLNADAVQLGYSIHNEALGTLLDLLREEHPEWLTNTLYRMHEQAGLESHRRDTEAAAAAKAAVPENEEEETEE